MEFCTHFVNGIIIEHNITSYGCPSEETLEQEAQFFLDAIEYRKKKPKKAGEEGYEFWRCYQENE